MDVTLIRNGYNLERRKMYIENPRHNLRSSIELMWQDSLHDNKSETSRRKEQSSEEMKQSYNRQVEKKIEDELRINKSTFRVMPTPQAYHTIDHMPSGYQDSLNRQLQNQTSMKNQYDSPIFSRDRTSRTQSLHKSVFGYDIDRQIFRKESYLSKILGDRLEPYLRGPSPMPRHQSFTINQPVSLQY